MNQKPEWIKTIMVLLSICCISIGLKVQAADNLDCISLNRDFSQLQQAKTKGLYRHSNSSDKTEFNYAGQSTFADYLAYSRQMINSNNPQASRPCPIATPVTVLRQQRQDELRVADLIAPFELRQPNNKKAILLIHGLTDSPFLFHDLAGFFYQQGFSVRTLLLPGHATAPSDLLDVSYRQWQQAARYAIERTTLDFEQVYLGGFSTGGALIFDYLLRQPDVSPNIAGLLMWSPASQAKDPLAFLAGIVDWIPGLDWVNQGADTDFAKYESFAFNA